jgi:hypothetical protein
MQDSSTLVDNVLKGDLPKWQRPGKFDDLCNGDPDKAHKFGPHVAATEATEAAACMKSGTKMGLQKAAESSAK